MSFYIYDPLMGSFLRQVIDKFENELQTTVPEPTTPEYEAEKEADLGMGTEEEPLEV